MTDVNVCVEPDWSKPQKVLVARLLQFYNPYAVIGITKDEYLAHDWPPQDFVPENSSERHQKTWDYGRITYFVNRLKADAPVEPIEIDMKWHGSSCTGLVLVDGHHRLIAADISGTKVVAIGGGVISVLDWLAGVYDVTPAF